jgi:hypothetical protein
MKGRKFFLFGTGFLACVALIVGVGLLSSYLSE